MPLTLCAPKPEIKELDGSSLGAQLRKRRRELKLRRCDVAATIGCDAKSLMWWERDEREPTERFYPRIVQFLGCEPWPRPTSLGGQLHAERKRRGLSQIEAARVLKVDEGTFGRWERGEWAPRRSLSKAKIAKFLTSTPK